jgi:hypothetical protein
MATLHFGSNNAGFTAQTPCKCGLSNTQLAGMALTPNVGGSAEVPPALIAKPGKYPVYLILKPQNQRVELGTFEVLP